MLNKANNRIVEKVTGRLNMISTFVYETLQIGERGCRNAGKVGGVLPAELGGADLVPEAI